MADQTNAEVSDERLREIEQAILLLRPAGNIAYNMKYPGAVSPNAGGAAYEFGRINDAVNAAIKLLSSARRSVTSQASEGADEPFMWVREYPGHFGPDGGEPPSIDFSDVEKPGYFPLYRVAPVSKRVERLETLLTQALHVLDQPEIYTIWPVSALRMEITQALQGGRS